MTLIPFLCAASMVVASSFSLLGTAMHGQATSAAPAGKASPAPASPRLPLWAYPDAFGSNLAPGDPAELLHVPGSKAGYTRPQLASLFSVPDWFPDAHPAMPAIVRQGRAPSVGGCGHCHLPNGFGRPENESIAGLPPAYMLAQIEDFKGGLRHSSDPSMRSVTNMIVASKNMTPEEAKVAIAYFASIKPTKWIRVVETDTVPRTHPAAGMMVVDQGTEPIGERVIEVSENYEQTELRNPTSGFVAYVPKGSLKEGEALVKTGGSGKTLACTTCHGPDLRGMGNIPSIAGRSPSQMTRQLLDFQSGARSGAGTQMMKMPVARLNLGDIVSITGYLASLEP